MTLGGVNCQWNLEAPVAIMELLLKKVGAPKRVEQQFLEVQIGKGDGLL